MVLRQRKGNGLSEIDKRHVEKNRHAIRAANSTRWRALKAGLPKEEVSRLAKEAYRLGTAIEISEATAERFETCAHCNGRGKKERV